MELRTNLDSKFVHLPFPKRTNTPIKAWNTALTYGINGMGCGNSSLFDQLIN